MVAVLSPRIPTPTPTSTGGADASRATAAPWNAPGAVERTGRPDLRLVQGGAASSGALRRVVTTLVAGVGLAAVVALAAIGATQLLGAGAAASGPASTADPLHPAGAGASTSPAPAVVVVEAGDTLWSIARELQPTGDPRPLVDALAERAGGPALVIGQRLEVGDLVG